MMIRVRRVVGDSMLPTLCPGQIVIACKLGQTYLPGDIVIVEHDSLEIIKRLSEIRIKRSQTEVFIRGDNKAASTDSRQYGWLPVNVLKGKVIWPMRLHKNLTT